MNHSLARLVCILGLAFGSVSIVTAQDLGRVKERMEARIASLDALKVEGALGENSRGFLEVRAEQGDAKAVAAAENADRAVVYAAISKQTGVTVESVGVARAKQIAAASKPGVWLQREDGGWYKK